MKLTGIAEALSAEISGDADPEIDRVVHPADARDGRDLAVALKDDALEALAASPAGAAVVAADCDRDFGDLPVVRFGGDERVAIALLTRLFDPGPAHDEGVHPTAVIAGDAEIGEDVAIGPHAVVGAGTRIGARSVVLANATIGAGVEIGAGCTLHPGVVIGDGVRIGDRVVVHAASVIGADGFSYIPAEGEGRLPEPIRSLGTVVIEDDVEIGAGSAIDRATLRETRIGRGTKIDNHVQIGHNTIVGEACLICGKAGVAGSVVIGDRVLLGAAAGLRDHITVGTGATVAALSGVGSNVAAGTVVSGRPAQLHTKISERYANVARLRTLYRQFAALVERVKVLEVGSQGSGQDERAESTGGNNGRRG